MQETPVSFLGPEDSLEKAQATTPVFWPRECHGLYSPWGHKESGTTEPLSLSHVDIIKIKCGNRSRTFGKLTNE